VSGTEVEIVIPDPLEASLRAAKDLAATSGRRDEIPVRRAFVRNEDPTVKPPLAKLVSSGGRGGAVPLKLYLALIWRCSAERFQTDILARKWALLLGLDQPNTLGARRITKALAVLEGERLVHLERRRGESTIVTLLHESGSGSPYTLPSTAHERADESDKPAHRYFKVPLALWTQGHVQSMSAAALAMLLVLIEERNLDGRPTWWSTERFPRLFALSPTIRSKGTAELEDRGLIRVTKQLVTPATGPAPTFSRDRVRNTYKLRGVARPLAMIEAEKKASEEFRRKDQKRRLRRPQTQASAARAPSGLRRRGR
jgi:hypothetical protein